MQRLCKVSRSKKAIYDRSSEYIPVTPVKECKRQNRLKTLVRISLRKQKSLGDCNQRRSHVLKIQKMTQARLCL